MTIITFTTALGIDPGLDGAFVSVTYNTGSRHPNRIWMSMPVPTIQGRSKGRQIDEALLATNFSANFAGEFNQPEQAFIEQVSAMPKQGAVSMFKFGYCAGIQRGLVIGAGIPFTVVSPGEWKHYLKLGSNKEASLERAGQLFPLDVKLFRSERGVRNQAQAIGLAEAAMIAYYGLHQAELRGTNGTSP